jgi:hypothetical protein
MSKPRSPLLTMPEAHQAKLAEWLLNGMNYHTARELCSKEFGVTVKSTSGFSNFWDVVCEPALLRQRARAVKTADAIGQAAAESNRLDQSIVAQIKQKSFELLIKPNIDPKELIALLSLYTTLGDQDIKRAKLALDRQKLSEFTCEKFLAWFKDKKARDIAESNISTPDKIAQLRQTYFADVDQLEQAGEVKLPT